uniref:Uncharacterized protein n=1 Tax=Amphora coffeiformis TaxID=265554 RepID=A0A7S3P8G2_9STRA|mmetsp:Transcript_13805/g.26495  ORF Transcript_13805/g.26495 Transcript_13805/m.26495 type:complete len:189 (+) Transcript_13805:106-672(+)|eukprot:scaffold3740_cov146-Amphora_coffeaeformis.AAC.5
MFYLLSFLLLAFAVLSEARMPFFGKRKEYTPLVFFTVPKGLMPECDAVEKAVRDVEKELGVRVERLDILRNPTAEAAMSLLTNKSPPFLYHRESCQTVHIPPATGEASAASVVPTYVDKDRLRAWATGRYLSPQVGKAKVKPPQVISQDGTAMEQDELLEDLSLTPLQRKGKEAIKERTEKRANNKKS